jgi:hypothetical protein
MEIPKFIGDEDEDEINLMEWLRLVKEYGMDPLEEKRSFFGDAWKWWMIMDKYNRWNNISKEFEKLFLDKWIRDAKMEAMYRIQEDLKKEK